MQTPIGESAISAKEEALELIMSREAKSGFDHMGPAVVHPLCRVQSETEAQWPGGLGPTSFCCDELARSMADDQIY